MNIFRLTGDLLHLFAIVGLLYKIWKTGNCSGISGKTQLLFAIIYTVRYVDLITSYISVYNSSLKIIFITISYVTVYLIYVRLQSTYEHTRDTFRIELLILGAMILAIFINHEFTVMEVLWSFSIYLEAVAMLPQLFFVAKAGEKKRTMNYYVFAMATYKGFYILNWIYRYYTQDFYDFIAVGAGIVHVFVYFSYFCIPIYKKESDLSYNAEKTPVPTMQSPTPQYISNCLLAETKDEFPKIHKGTKQEKSDLANSV
ncbi:ER lumen protein-retaining receptor-like [Hylaeus anthracinus]|uniref:ER lumen protein-retaining receptor-like n=1 Tax=Hylaeus anthracinus TaxID=313031 RepID=UPI0023B8D154|nr:ER lumen protein-retaining receptor-like [Hylaeus anthracinus]